MKFGPWEIRFEDDAILLDGAPIEVRSWGHAGSLVTARDHAERWLAILRQEAERRRDLRLQAFPDPLA
jgi:DNA-binding transcriptional MocR family regulator